MIRCLRPFALALVTLFAAAAFAADQNTFVILVKGKPSGRASYTIDTVKDGFRIRSRYEFHVHAADIGASPSAPDTDTDAGPRGARSNGIGSTGLIDGQISSEYRISPDGLFLGGYTQDTTQTISSFTPEKDRTIITLNHTQAGASGLPQQMNAPSGEYTFLPRFDPSAVQVLLTTATAHPHGDKTYLFLVPGLNSFQQPTLQMLAIDPTVSEPAAGTLDGKPVTLKHFLVRLRSGDAQVYTDEKGTLMEADIDPLSTSYVRTKFVLNK